MNAAIRRLAAIGLALSTWTTVRGDEPPSRQDPRAIEQDKGAVGTYQKLLKLRTTASVMHVTAHPDDEDAALLTWLSRGVGARTSLLTLNRGEAGDNAIGPELFDALGLIRTEELREAARAYGLDAQYYTTAIDYGFSKRLDEAIDKWGHDRILEEMVRLIRKERPLILISRFQGNPSDGHGNHQAAGLLAREAFEAAGDPNRLPGSFPPWKPLKFYKGTGFFGAKNATIRVDLNVFSPWLGETYADFAAIGYAMHRSQNNGNRRVWFGPRFASYDRLMRSGEGEPPAREDGFFDGIHTDLPGFRDMLGLPEPNGVREKLEEVQNRIDEALRAFRIDDPTACVPPLAQGLSKLREAIETGADAGGILARKQIQFEDAIVAALGIRIESIAVPENVKEPSGPFAAFAPPTTMGPVVPGQTVKVFSTFVNPSRMPVELLELGVFGKPDGTRISPVEKAERLTLENGRFARATDLLTVSPRSTPSRPYFSRKSLHENLYKLSDVNLLGEPFESPRYWARAILRISGTKLELWSPVSRREADPPFGQASRVLDVVPRLAVGVKPRAAIIPTGSREKGAEIQVEIAHNAADKTAGELRLDAPSGWRVEPASKPFSFDRAGERASFAFRLVPEHARPGSTAEIRAVAESSGAEYREEFETIRHRGLETRYLVRPAAIEAKVIDVKIAPDLKVGYIMGVGDDVPRAIDQLGAKTTLLTESDLADGNLSRFDAIVTGTRAYAVREDLRTYNARLLDYVKQGGNLIVLYNTPEFVPDRFAPFPAKLPGNAEEICEEDAPVEILDPKAEVLNFPNVVTPADFAGWVEQRGSKFWSEWDKAYAPLLSSRDRGQKPQRGGWLSAKYGKGRYTYFAYALHRQLPNGVPGAYRLLANLLSQGKP